MLSPLVLQRVSSRAFAPNVAATTALRSALVVRHHLARTFLTTAQVSEPVAGDSESTKSKSKAKATTTKKPAAKKTGAAGTTKATAKKSKKVEADDPEARLKMPLKSAPLVHRSCMLCIDPVLLALAGIKLRKDEKPPTGPPTAYSLFLRELYVISPKFSNRDEFKARSKQAAAKWKQLSEEEKKVRLPLRSPFSHPFLSLTASHHIPSSHTITRRRRCVRSTIQSLRTGSPTRIHASSPRTTSSARPTTRGGSSRPSKSVPTGPSPRTSSTYPLPLPPPSGPIFVAPSPPQFVAVVTSRAKYQ